MKDGFPKIGNLAGIGFLAAAVLMTTPATSQAQQDEVLAEGRMEYEENCMACHGEAGKGDGRMAEILIVQPSDVTQISKKSGGVFPFWRIYRIIEVAEPVRGHLFFPMPVWRNRFGEDERKPGYPAAHLRILVLTHYLESIQEE
jgi:hypothetical protein